MNGASSPKIDAEEFTDHGSKAEINVEDFIDLLEVAPKSERKRWLRKKTKRTQQKTENHIVTFNYQETLKLAKLTRSCLLAVMAELHHRQFENWEKDEPITLGNKVFEDLGFCHKDKIRALKELEKSGWVTVQWQNRKSPTIFLRRGFFLPEGFSQAWVFTPIHMGV